MMSVNIGRPGPFGNPFIIGRDGTRAEVVAKHRVWVFAPEQAALRERMRRQIPPDAARWCPGCRGTKPCHDDNIADVLKETE